MNLEKILVELAKQVAETKALAHASALAQQTIIANLSGMPPAQVQAIYVQDLEHWKRRYLEEVLAALDLPGPEPTGRN